MSLLFRFIAFCLVCSLYTVIGLPIWIVTIIRLLIIFSIAETMALIHGNRATDWDRLDYAVNLPIRSYTRMLEIFKKDNSSSEITFNYQTILAEILAFFTTIISMSIGYSIMNGTINLTNIPKETLETVGGIAILVALVYIFKMALNKSTLKPYNK